MADKMIRCPEGHFYDPSKHNLCPWCALPSDTAAGAQNTRPVSPGAMMDAPPPLPVPGAGPAAAPVAGVAPGTKPGATRRIGQEVSPGKPDPVVGWLVCLEGPDRGRDFRLHAEKNFIGRSPAMDVCIPGDDTVSREKHGIVIFDPKKQVFWALPGDSSGLVYVNSEIVHTPTLIKAGDILEVGQTKLVLIPFCGEKYTWNYPSAAPPPATQP
jgi:hypothetical protein